MSVQKRKIINSEGIEETQWESDKPEPTVNPIRLPERHIGNINLTLGMVEVQEFNTDVWKKARLKQKLFPGDIVRIGARARVEIKIPSGGEVGEKWIVRIGEQSEFAITSANLKEAARNYGISQYKQGNLYESFETAFTDKPIGKKRLPTAVAAIYG
jgi:hypothetical protein